MNTSKKVATRMSPSWIVFAHLLVIALFFFNLNLFSTNKVAELELKLQTVTGKERFEVLHELSYLVYKANPLKSMEYAEEAVIVAEKLGNKVDRARAIRNIGLGYQILGDYPKALGYYYETLEQAGKLKQTRLIAVASLSISTIYFRLCDLKKANEYVDYALKIIQEIGDDSLLLVGLNEQANIIKKWGKFDKALQNHFKVLRIKEKKNMRRRVGITYHNIALIYTAIKDYDTALEFLEKALEVNREFNHSMSIARNLHAVGDVFYHRNQFQKALETFNEAKAIIKKLNLKPDLALLLIDQGKVETKLNRLDDAMRSYNQALEISTEISYPFGRCTALLYHGELLKFKKEYRASLDKFLKAIEIAEKANLKKEQVDCYLDISDVYAQLGDTRKSHEYFKKHANAKDEIFNPLVSKEIRDLQLKYEKDKIALAIQDIKKSRTWILLSAFVLMTVSIVVFCSRYRIKVNARKLIYEKEKELAAREDRIQALTEELKQYMETKERKKYERSTLSEKQAACYMETLLEYMEDEQAYLDPDLTIKELSEQLSIPARDLSQVINERLNQNFNDFVNHYRIEKAKELLLKMDDNSTILDVAFDSGFNSKSSFNTLFKKITRYTPSQYKKTFGKYRTGTFPVVNAA